MFVYSITKGTVLIFLLLSEDNIQVVKHLLINSCDVALEIFFHNQLLIYF